MQQINVLDVFNLIFLNLVQPSGLLRSLSMLFHMTLCHTQKLKIIFVPESLQSIDVQVQHNMVKAKVYFTDLSFQIIIY